MEQTAQEPKRITRKQKFGDEEIEVVYREARRPGVGGHFFAFAAPLEPKTYMPEPGIVCDQDVPCTLRDGTIIYSDIYRPVDATNLPVIISWSMFGKRQAQLVPEWQLMGVPPQTVSTMAKFESADPAYWCRQGYACANVDPRGVGNSEGDVQFFNTQDGRDGHDYIEWIATQHWCSGKVALFGNSGVAMTQWRIAAEQPPHLVCVAPWEGTGDIFRESFREGGIPGLFGEGIVSGVTGRGYVEDTTAMTEKYPFMNAYWEDKIPQWEKIRIPCYTTVCWNHFHLRGSMDGFRKIRSPKKWLRAHRDFEWPDTYSPEGLEDLKRFLDRYCKDIRNGWELTPRVRLEVMDAYDINYQTNRPEKEFPLARTQYKKLYLDASKGTLSGEPMGDEAKVSYDSQTEATNFDIKFSETTELTGYLRLHMWVEADGYDDMDLFVAVKKLDENGNFIPMDALGEPHPGAWGKLRVSRRELDEKLSTDFQPVYAHKREQKLKKGEIVCIDMEIWPISRIWHKGQQLRVEIAGRYIREPGWFERLEWATDNKGKHIIHTGGTYDSFLQVPVIPPKYVAGDHVYR